MVLSEDAVVDACCKHLEKKGFSILSKAYGSEHGVDVIAEGEEFKVLIEAKGSTSGRKGSNRYGLPFNSNQVFDVVAKAIFKAMTNRSSSSYSDGDVLAIALPDTPLFRHYHERVSHSLAQIQLVTFWVSESDGTTHVSVEDTKYNFASVEYPFIEDFERFVKNTEVHDFAVGDIKKRSKQGFDFYPDENWQKNKIPFFARWIGIGWRKLRMYYIDLDTHILSGILDSIVVYERIRSLK